MKLRFLLLAALTSCVAMAVAPSAQEILARTAATYKSLTSYQFQATIQTIRGENASQRRIAASPHRPPTKRQFMAKFSVSPNAWTSPRTANERQYNSGAFSNRQGRWSSVGFAGHAISHAAAA